MKNIIKYISLLSLLFVFIFLIICNNNKPKASIDISLRIAACNLSFEDSVKIEYAIESTGIEDYENIQVSAYETIDDYIEDKNSHKLTYLENRVINDSTYSIFIDKDVAAKQMTTNFYVYATYKNDGYVYGADLVKYSILQYVKNMYGTPKSNKELDDTLLAMMEYGACTQKLFDYKEDRLANDTYYELKLENGTLEDRFSHGLFNSNEEVKIYCLEDNFHHWENIADESVYSSEKETTISLSSNLSLRAVTYLEGSKGLVYTKIDGADEYELSSIGTCIDNDIIVAKFYNSLPVTKIADSVFEDNTSITSLYIQSTLDEIGDAAFSGCTNLRNVALTNKEMKIGENAFYGCTSLEGFVMPDISNFDSNIFEGCTKLKNIYYLNSLDYFNNNLNKTQQSYMNNYNVYFYTETYDTIMFMDNFNYWHFEQDDVAIWNSPNDSSSHLAIDINEQTNTACVIEGSLITDEDVYIPSFYRGVPVTEIKTSCFSGNEYIKNVYFGRNIKKVNEHAFKGCTNLTNVYMNDSVEKLSMGCFAGCSSLKYVKLSSSLTTLSEELFSNTSLEYLDIPEGVTTLESGSLFFIDGIEYIILPSTLTYIGDGAMSFTGKKQCKIFYKGSYEDFKNITILNHNRDLTYYNLYFYQEPYKYEEGNYWHYEDGVPVVLKDNLFDYEYNEEGKYLICKGKKDEASTIIIPSRNNGADVLSIYMGAFASSTDIEKLIISEGILNIGKDSFEGCTNLVSVTLPSSLETIGFGAFAYCSNLSSIIIKENVTSIGYGSFIGCTSLTKAIILGNLTTIEESLFGGCENLESIILNSSVTSIKEYAFCDCSSLSYIYYMGDEVSFNNINISSGNEDFSNANVYYYSETYPITANPTNYWHYVNGEPSIWENNNFTFTLINEDTEYEITSYNDSISKEVVIPTTYNNIPVTRIGNEAFINKTNVTTVYLPSSIKSIGDNAFEGMTNLGNIYYLDTITNFMDINYSFQNNVTFENKVRFYQSSYDCTCIDTNFWYYKDGVPTIWESTKGLLLTVDEYKFECTISGLGSCFLDKEIIIPSHYNGIPITRIDDFNFFYSNDVVEALYIPGTIKELGQNSINSCSNLKTIVLQHGLIRIESFSICLCDSLEYLILPSSITYISGDSFYFNDNLTKIYYLGTEDSFNKIEGKDVLNQYTIYFYSKTLPTTEGNYFNLVDGEVVEWE